MAATFELRILTPVANVFDEQVVSIVAPGQLGYLGVLANHAPLITTLVNGDLKVTTEAGNKWYRIEGGILCVARNRAVLLSESVAESPEPPGN